LPDNQEMKRAGAAMLAQVACRHTSGYCLITAVIT
jgi:hypothetical protein